MLLRPLVLGLLALVFATRAQAVTLFQDSFQTNDLATAWAGAELPCSQGRSASLFADPQNSGQNALGFNRGGCGSDIVTTNSFSAASGSYILSFDYLNLVGGNGAGGFVGLVEGGSFQGWLAMDATAYGHAEPYGQWTHVTAAFSTSSPFQLSIEQWSDLYAGPGTALYKNFTLTDEAGPSPTTPDVPEPASLGLLGAGLALLRLRRRK